MRNILPALLAIGGCASILQHETLPANALIAGEGAERHVYEINFDHTPSPDQLAQRVQFCAARHVNGYTPGGGEYAFTGTAKAPGGYGFMQMVYTVDFTAEAIPTAKGYTLSFREFHRDVTGAMGNKVYTQDGKGATFIYEKLRDLDADMALCIVNAPAELLSQ
ncbi:hypothetical protein FF098_014675 [Parvularcula flava]|uniref:Uncharacterized protein n=1 Tax=Aquisalinus luteolus TaxID=1566827 RepID=A0A8J3A8P2_9PROT|nr:hypothetical protein [Aquisalinus luteolus]NHK29162.1 hypothetical protein [Aquisalinus luteolus]GGI00116.1 hypothetical protein GCM10011355_27650 [Aquisalinus luteolus]